MKRYQLRLCIIISVLLITVNCMFGFGAQELILIIIIILLLFGGKKLPELSKSIAESIKTLRKGFTDNTDDDNTKKQND